MPEFLHKYEHQETNKAGELANHILDCGDARNNINGRLTLGCGLIESTRSVFLKGWEPLVGLDLNNIGNVALSHRRIEKYILWQQREQKDEYFVSFMPITDEKERLSSKQSHMQFDPHDAINAEESVYNFLKSHIEYESGNMPPNYNPQIHRTVVSMFMSCRENATDYNTSAGITLELGGIEWQTKYSRDESGNETLRILRDPIEFTEPVAFNILPNGYVRKMDMTGEWPEGNTTFVPTEEIVTDEHEVFTLQAIVNAAHDLKLSN